MAKNTVSDHFVRPIFLYVMVLLRENDSFIFFKLLINLELEKNDNYLNLKHGNRSLSLVLLTNVLFNDEIINFSDGTVPDDPLPLSVSGLKDPITFMGHVTPMMAVATAIFSLLLDPWQEFRRNNYFNNSWHVMRSCLLMLLGGTLAFFMVKNIFEDSFSDHSHGGFYFFSASS